MDKQISFIDREKRKPESIDEHRQSLEWLYSQVKDLGIDSSMEYFGGLGVSSDIIIELFEPSYHTIFENDEKCFGHLVEKFKGNYRIKIFLCDSFKKFGSVQAHHVSLDLPKFTFLQFTKKVELYRKIFCHKPKFVDLTDTSLSYFHVHRKRYAQLMGKENVTYEEYLQGYSDYIYDKFGYSIFYACTHGNSTHMGILSGKNDGKIKYHRVS